jgi:hypothetical protein
VPSGPIPDHMRARFLLPIGVSFAAALAAQLEGTAVTLWAADRTTACDGSSPAEACSLNAFIAFIAGSFFAVETLAATLVALVLLRNGKRFGAAVAATALAAALAVEHIWLLT